MATNKNSVAEGFKHGLWFALAIASVWAASTFASAAWGALPNAGTTLSSTAWNDIVSQLNALAWGLSVSGGDVTVRGNLTTASELAWVPYASNLPNDMSFGADGAVYGSNTGPMPVGTYFYQVYGCAGQNNFTGWALGTVNFVSGSGSATLTNYFDNTNVGGGSCGYFLQGFIKITAPGSVVRFKITNNYAWGSNVDQNPTANSFGMHAWKIY